MNLRLVAIAGLAGLALAAPAAQASFAGDNGRIYFATSRQGSGIMDDIYSITTRGTKMRRLANLPRNQREPAVSPAGDQVAIWSSEPGDAGVWLMGANGSNPELLESSVTNTQPAFAADGETVAFRDLVDGAGELDDEHIFTVPTSGGSPTPLLAEPGERYRGPTFSADGELMAFTKADENPQTQSWNVYVANADGTKPVRVTSLRGDEYNPDFSPNGRKLVFWTRRPSGESDVYSVRIDGTGLRRLTSRNGVSEWMPDYSPDGKRIVYMRELGQNPDLFTMNANGSQRRALTHLKRGAKQPDWATKRAG